MIEVIAGHEARAEASSGWPAHVVVTGNPDFEPYGESDLSDAELLGIAAQDAVEAQESRLLAGPPMDEVAYRRAMRQALRPLVAAGRTGVAA